MKHSKNTLSFPEYEARMNLALDHQIPVIVKSGPGEGKTQSTKQLAVQRAANYLSVENKKQPDGTVKHSMTWSPSLVLNAVNKNPSHVNGLPHMTENGASFSHYDFMRAIFDATHELIVIIDDILLATQIMQGSFMNLIEERAIDGKAIPDCVKFIITTNEAGQNAGSGSLLSPLINRCLILDFPRDVNNWLTWALDNNVSKKIVMFVHAFPDCLYSDSYPKGIVAFNSPRSFTKLSHFVDAAFQDSLTMGGLINPETAVKASAFFDQLDKFGNVWSKINADPLTAPVFTELSDRYGILMICANKFDTKENVTKIVQYFSRYKNDELLSILYAIGTSNFPDSKETKEYVHHIALNS